MAPVGVRIALTIVRDAEGRHVLLFEYLTHEGALIGCSAGLA